MPTYTVNGLDSNMVRGLIAELKKERTAVKRCVQDVCVRLAEIGMKQASQDFASVPYQGTKDYSLSVEPIKNGAKLSAVGESVYFLEYGAGAFQPNYEGVTPPDLGRGSWSLSKKGKGHWDDPNGWYYAHGKKSWGNPPSNAMYHAEQEIYRQMEKVVADILYR